MGRCAIVEVKVVQNSPDLHRMFIKKKTSLRYNLDIEYDKVDTFKTMKDKNGVNKLVFLHQV